MRFDDFNSQQQQFSQNNHKLSKFEKGPQKISQGEFIQEDDFGQVQIEEQSNEQESMSMSMAEETRELLNINTHLNQQQQNPNQSTEYRSTAQRSFTCEDLSVSDHLTDAEAIDFWRRYFGDISHSRVSLDQFCEAIQAEYATIVFRNLFGDLPNGAINEDQLVSEFYDDLQGRVSIDQDVVSLNALELFSRKKGLKSAIRSLMEDALSRHRAQRSLKLNDTIVSELADVKKMLDAKSEQIAQREKELKKRESLL